MQRTKFQKNCSIEYHYVVFIGGQNALRSIAQAVKKGMTIPGVGGEGYNLRSTPNELILLDAVRTSTDQLKGN